MRKPSIKEGKTLRELSQHSATSVKIKVLGEVEKIFIEYDVDGNGQLDLKETQEFIVQRTHEYMPEMEHNEVIEHFVDRIDVDGDKMVSREELFEYLYGIMSAAIAAYKSSPDYYDKKLSMKFQ